MAEWLEKYHGLSQRERLLVVATVVIALYLLVSLLIWGPMGERQAKDETELQSLDSKLVELNSQIDLYQNIATADPDADKKQQVASLKQQKKIIEDQLAAMSLGLVPAEELPRLLQQVLEKNIDLRLLSMETLPVTELSLQGQELRADDLVVADADGVAVDSAAGVFKHAVVLNLRGGFFELRNYLQKLEDLPWRLYWGTLSYQLNQYPNGDIRLQVYTLSTEEGAFVH